MGQTLDLIPYPDGWFAIAEDAVPSLPASFKPLAEMRFQTRRIDDREVIVRVELRREGDQAQHAEDRADERRKVF